MKDANEALLRLAALTILHLSAVAIAFFGEANEWLLPYLTVTLLGSFFMLSQPYFKKPSSETLVVVLKSTIPVLITWVSSVAVKRIVDLLWAHGRS